MPSHSGCGWASAGVSADSGILQMVARRGEAAGLPGLHPHRFRHSFAHNLKAANVPTEEVMMLGGWRDPGTVARYGRGAAAERAIAAYAHVAPGTSFGEAQVDADTDR